MCRGNIELMASKRRCKGKTKAGKACRAKPLKGSDFCISHSDKAVQAEVGFGGSLNGALGGAATRKPRAVDVLRERMEERIDEVLAPLFDALTASRGIALTIKGGGMEIGYTPDHAARLAAVKELLDRAYGRPKQMTELTGADGEAIQIQALSEFEREVKELTKQMERQERQKTPDGKRNGGRRTHA